MHAQKTHMQINKKSKHETTTGMYSCAAGNHAPTEPNAKIPTQITNRGPVCHIKHDMYDPHHHSLGEQTEAMYLSCGKHGMQQAQFRDRKHGQLAHGLPFGGTNESRRTRRKFHVRVMIRGDRDDRGD